MAKLQGRAMLAFVGREAYTTKRTFIGKKVELRSTGQARRPILQKKSAALKGSP